MNIIILFVSFAAIEVFKFQIAAIAAIMGHGETSERLTTMSN
jgi:hypothetical protein